MAELSGDFPSGAGRSNPSLANTPNIFYITGARTATVHPPAGAPAPQPVPANRRRPNLAPVPTPDAPPDPLGFDDPPNPRFRVDHWPPYRDEALEGVARVNDRTRPVPDYHPYADPIRDSDFDPGRTMVQRAFTIRDWHGPYEDRFGGQKSLPERRASQPFGAGTMYAEDPRINRQRPTSYSYGDQTGEEC